MNASIVSVRANNVPTELLNQSKQFHECNVFYVIIMDIKWKPMPKSFPGQSPETVSPAEINKFFDLSDLTFNTQAGSSLQRDESFAESTQSDTEQQQKNSRFWRARDSIFITKDHLRAHTNDDDEEEDDEEEIQIEPQEVETVVPRSNLSQKNDTTKKNRVSVRFSSLPDENGGGQTNPAFVDDHENRSEDYAHTRVDTTEWQRSEYISDSEEHWQTNSSDDDDDDE